MLARCHARYWISAVVVTGALTAGADGRADLWSGMVNQIKHNVEEGAAAVRHEGKVVGQVWHEELDKFESSRIPNYQLPKFPDISPKIPHVRTPKFPGFGGGSSSDNSSGGTSSKPNPGGPGVGTPGNVGIDFSGSSTPVPVDSSPSKSGAPVVPSRPSQPAGGTVGIQTDGMSLMLLGDIRKRQTSGKKSTYPYTPPLTSTNHTTFRPIQPLSSRPPPSASTVRDPLHGGGARLGTHTPIDGNHSAVNRESNPQTENRAAQQRQNVREAIRRRLSTTSG